EEEVVVLLDLGAGVGILRIFDRERVEAEEALERLEILVAWRLQIKPSDRPLVPQRLSNLLGLEPLREHAGGTPDAAVVLHLRGSRSRRRAGRRRARGSWRPDPSAFAPPGARPRQRPPRQPGGSASDSRGRGRIARSPPGCPRRPPPF